MMNIQNPASYPPQQAYTAYGNSMAQPGMQPSSYPNDFSQNQFQQPFPHTAQRPNQFPQQPGSQVRPNAYQQFQQQQQQQAFARPQSRGNNGLIPEAQQRQSPSNVPPAGQNQHQASRTSAPQVTANAQHISNNMAMAAQMQQGMTNPSLAQQVQMQNAAQQMNRPVQPPTQQQSQGTNQTATQATNSPLSPQSASREKARVTVLLDINSHLLQEVISLQTQGKAGPVTQQPNNASQQSPTSPSAASTEQNAFSPTDSAPQTKASGPPSKEYQECMRRLQANLSYLAAIADAKKRPDGKVPPYPAIISPPPHLKAVHESYKKLAMLFPEASQSKTNQAIAFASAQHQPSGQSGQQPNNVNQSGMGNNANLTSASAFEFQGQQMG